MSLNKFAKIFGEEKEQTDVISTLFVIVASLKDVGQGRNDQRGCRRLSSQC